MSFFILDVLASCFVSPASWVFNRTVCWQWTKICECFNKTNAAFKVNSILTLSVNFYGVWRALKMHLHFTVVNKMSDKVEHKMGCKRNNDYSQNEQLFCKLKIQANSSNVFVTKVVFYWNMQIRLVLAILKCNNVYVFHVKRKTKNRKTKIILL